ncbi:hypothetical protein C8R45DRAFT_1103391 [Mycena sanguinolenta]|nr:hypothetical protein C8R45DRAFT_1103391 [Mycena sanguinolenta]
MPCSPPRLRVCDLDAALATREREGNRAAPQGGRGERRLGLTSRTGTDTSAVLLTSTLGTTPSPLLLEVPKLERVRSAADIKTIPVVPALNAAASDSLRTGDHLLAEDGGGGGGGPAPVGARDGIVDGHERMEDDAEY